MSISLTPQLAGVTLEMPREHTSTLELLDVRSSLRCERAYDGRDKQNQTPQEYLLCHCCRHCGRTVHDGANGSARAEVQEPVFLTESGEQPLTAIREPVSQFVALKGSGTAALARAIPDQQAVAASYAYTDPHSAQSEVQSQRRQAADE